MTKTSTLAWLMWLVGVLGWLLLLSALILLQAVALDFKKPQAGLMEFFGLVFGAAFLIGLSQAWLTSFGWLGRRALAAAGRLSSGTATWLGSLGFACTTGLVVGVMLVAASPPDNQALLTVPPSVGTILVAALVGLATLLWLERRWLALFRARTDEA